ncbi:MAG TPA: hypothetical protein VGL28_00650 [Steroidobacteraceae bacterium]|jgi:HSP20 family molecular chaperone IbpA
MATKSHQVAEHQSSAGATQSTRAAEAAMRFPVDIFEDGEGITLAADMPGVSKDGLDVRIDGDNLLLEGKLEFDLPGHAKRYRPTCARACIAAVSS